MAMLPSETILRRTLLEARVRKRQRAIRVIQSNVAHHPSDGCSFVSFYLVCLLQALRAAASGVRPDPSREQSSLSQGKPKRPF